jgi:hypothetical protein
VANSLPTKERQVPFIFYIMYNYIYIYICAEKNNTACDVQYATLHLVSIVLVFAQFVPSLSWQIVDDVSSR